MVFIIKYLLHLLVNSLIILSGSFNIIAKKGFIFCLISLVGTQLFVFIHCKAILKEKLPFYHGRICTGQYEVLHLIHENNPVKVKTKWVPTQFMIIFLSLWEQLCLMSLSIQFWMKTQSRYVTVKFTIWLEIFHPSL
jgi:hypothetical protein